MAKRSPCDDLDVRSNSRRAVVVERRRTARCDAALVTLA